MLRAGAALLVCTVVLAALLVTVNAAEQSEQAQEPAEEQAEASTSHTKVWETEATLGDTVVVFELSGGQSCGVRVDFSGRLPSTGVVDRIYLEETPGGQTKWFHATLVTSLSHVHVADVFDTRFGGHQLWASVTEFDVSGDSTLTVAATNLQAWSTNLQDEWEEDGTPMGKYSIRVQLDCNSGFTADVKMGEDPEIVTMRGIESGVGLTSPTENVVALSQTQRTFTEPEVRLRAATDGAEAGRMTLAGTGVAENWLLYPGSPRFLSADGPSGVYLLQLDRVQLDGDTFWAILTGLEPVDDFDEL